MAGSGTGTGGIGVAGVRARPYRGPLRRPFVTSRRRVEAITGVIVELELADGTVGLGSAAETFAVTGESTASIVAAVEGPIGEALVGPARSVRGHAAAVADSCVANSSARAAVDMALHDAWARVLGVPLVEALGGDAATGLATDMTVSLGEAGDMAQEAAAAVGQGYDVLKIKLGRNWRADLDRLTAVTRAAPSARLRLDANQGWDVKSAIRVIRAIEDAGLPVQLVEQPVDRRDLTGLAAVTRAVDTPIMADEAAATPADALELVSARAVDQINIKLAKCGGIGQALAIADIAAAGGVECMVGAMMEPRISITVAGHVAAAHPNITLVDLDAAEWVDDPDLDTGGYTMRRSVMQLHPDPGIGFETRPAVGSPATGHH